MNKSGQLKTPISTPNVGYILADAGYDVWMGNNRGTPFSKGHRKLSSDDKAYWDYYQMELGM